MYGKRSRRGSYIEIPVWTSVRVKQEELGPKLATVLVAPPKQAEVFVKPTLESRESKEGFLGGLAGLSMVDMVELGSNWVA